MSPATEPRAAGEMRLLVVDGSSGAISVASAADLPELLAPGDLVVVNDAATLPASLAARTEAGEPVEIRLVSSLDGARCWVAALLGAGDYRTRTEDRPLPPRLERGARLTLGARGLVAEIASVRHPSGRLVELAFSLEGRARAPVAEIWRAIYLAGRPVQYAHVPDALALWDVQNVFAGRPWAVEMPSAGRAIRASTLLALRRRGIEVARVTHAAGLSSIGDAELDRLFPLPERFDVPAETLRAVHRAHARGGRVLAIGTSVVRALESAEVLGVRSGVTGHLLGPRTRRHVVDAVLTGVHEADTSHFTLLRAFVRDDILSQALTQAEHAGFLGHEFGDGCLVWGSARARASPRTEARQPSAEC